MNSTGWLRNWADELMDMEEMESLWGYRPDVIRSAMSALDWHLGYFEFQGSAVHGQQMESFAEALMRSQGRTVAINTSLKSNAGALANDETQLIDLAQTVWVEADICTVIEGAVENMPNGILHETDLPMDHGLLVFSRPLNLDYQVNEMIVSCPLRALAWTKVRKGVGKADGTPPGDGLYIWLYTDRTYPRRSGRVSLANPDEVFVDEAFPGPELYPVDLTAWLFNDEWDDVRQRELSEQGMLAMRPQMVQVRKYLLALFLYMKEQIVDTSWVRLPRASRRRAERARLELPEAGSIRVVHLRKVVRPHQTQGNGDSHPQWSHRWWVRAHWRQIKGADGKHRLIPVRAHVKGPDDKPLVVKSEIYSVDR